MESSLEACTDVSNSVTYDFNMIRYKAHLAPYASYNYEQSIQAITNRIVPFMIRTFADLNDIQPIDSHEAMITEVIVNFVCDKFKFDFTIIQRDIEIATGNHVDMQPTNTKSSSLGTSNVIPFKR